MLIFTFCRRSSKETILGELEGYSLKSIIDLYIGAEKIILLVWAAYAHEKFREVSSHWENMLFRTIIPRARVGYEMTDSQRGA